MAKTIHEATIDTPPEGLPVWVAASRVQATNKCHCNVGGDPQFWVNKKVAYTIGKSGDTIDVPLYRLGIECKDHFWRLHFRAAEDEDRDTTFNVDLTVKARVPEKVPLWPKL